MRLDELNKMLNDIRTGKVSSDELKAMEAEPSVSAPVVEPVAGAPAATPAIDQMSMMMEMMKTMQSLQAEVAAMKGGTETKKSPGRPKKNTTA